MADLVRTEFPQVDFAMIQSGKLRSNALIPAGDLTRRFVATMLPEYSSLFLLSVPGQIFKEALENAVSAYPKYDGRFPTVSGYKFAFDPTKDAGQRIRKEDLTDEDGR